MGRFAAVAAGWRGTRRAAVAAHVVNLVCNAANVVMSNPNGDHTLDFNVNTGPMATIEANGLYTIESVDIQASAGYSQNYKNKIVVYLAWYGPLLGTLAKATLIFGTVALAPTEKIENVCGIGFDLTRRGADSIVNYLFHYYAVYALALARLYEHFTVGRYLIALTAAPLLAQFWMWRPVANFLKATLIFPDFEFLLVDMDPQRTDQGNDEKQSQKSSAEAKNSEAPAAAKEADTEAPAPPPLDGGSRSPAN